MLAEEHTCTGCSQVANSRGAKPWATGLPRRAHLAAPPGGDAAPHAPPCGGGSATAPVACPTAAPTCGHGQAELVSPGQSHLGAVRHIHIHKAWMVVWTNVSSR